MTTNAQRDPAAIFLFAEQYKHASNHLALARRNGLPHEVRMPAVVCSAFALELYLKCLLIVEGSSHARGHDLRILFDHLSEATRARIRACFAPRMEEARRQVTESATAAGAAVPNVTFDFLLDLSRDAFPATRYIYEGIPPGTGWAASGILDAARQAIIEMHPEWLNLEMSLGVGIAESPPL